MLAHISVREAPHMGFSSEAVASCSTVQWALPLIVTARRSLYHSHYFGRGCAGHFSILITGRHLPPRPGHTPSSPHKTITFERSVTCLLSIGWPPITQFTFRSRPTPLNFPRWTVWLMSIPTVCVFFLFSYGYSQQFDLVWPRGCKVSHAKKAHAETTFITIIYLTARRVIA